MGTMRLAPLRAIGWLYYRTINPSSFQRRSMWKIDSALPSPITLPITSLPRRLESSKNPPKEYLSPYRKASREREPCKVTSSRSASSSNKHSAPKSAPQNAGISRTDAFHRSPETIRPHLHLFKVGHRPPMIPAILLQTV